MALGPTGEPGDSSRPERERARPQRWVGLAARFALLVAVLACSRGVAAAIWTRSFGAPGQPSATRWIRPTIDGGVLVGGASGDDAWIAKLDAGGAVLWQRSSGDGSRYEKAVDGRELPDGSLVILVGRTDLILDTAVHLIKLDAGGGEIWQRALDAGESIVPSSLALTQDGGFLVGNLRGVGAARGVDVMRLDAAGGLAWEKLLPGVQAYTPPLVRAATDGGFLISFDAYLSSPPLGPRLVKLDAAGSLVWAKELETPVGRSALEETPDGGWLLAGNPSSLSGVSWLAKVDVAGAVQWTVRREGFRRGAETREWLDSVAVLPDGSFVAGGGWSRNLWQGTTESGALLLRGDAAGGMSWTRTIDDAGTSVVQVALAQTGDILLGATMGYDLSARAVVARLDPFGNAQGCVQQGTLSAPAATSVISVTPASAPFVDVVSSSLAIPLPSWDPGLPLACSGGCSSDGHEPDDACAIAPPIGRLPASLVRNFCDDAEDWLRIDACAGQTFTISTEALGPLADTVLDLFGSDCATLLASDDNGGGGLASLLTWTTVRSGPLLLRVSQADGSFGDDRGYALSMTLSAPPSRLFLRETGPLLNSSADSAAPTTPEGFVVAGGDEWVLGLDGAGMPAWSAQLQGGGAYSSVAVGASATGGALLAVGYVSGGGWDPPYPTLTRVDATGATIWDGQYEAWPLFAYPEAISELSDGGAITVGALGNYAWLLRLDASGALVWHVAFDIADSDHATCVLPLAGGDLLVAGTTWTRGSATRALVMRLDGAGNVIWARSFGDGVTAARADALGATADGGAIVAGASGSRGSTDVLVLKLDAAGSLQWSRTLDAGFDESAAAIASTADGGFVVTGTSQDVRPGYVAGEDLFIARHDAGGSLTWARRVRAAKGLAVSEVSGGDIMVAGAPALVLRMDASGLLASPCSSFSALPLAERGWSSATAPLSPTATQPPGILLGPRRVASPLPTGTADACDCACGSAQLPIEVAPVASAEPLRVLAGGRLTWEPASLSDACWFNVYRGDLARLRSGDHGQCLQPDLALGARTDPTPPPPGGAWFYLVTGESDAGEGPLGPDSLGQPRLNATPCP